MKKKILIVTSILFVAFLIIATVFFFLMKEASPSNPQNDPEGYDASQVIEKTRFLKLNSFEEIKAYAEEYPIYIQTSDDDSLFAIGELYIEDAPATLFYKLNDDGSLKRFDGKYTYVLDKASDDSFWDIISYVDYALAQYFGTEDFEHGIYDEEGAPINAYSDESYELMLNGKAKYNLSVIDESNTYWNISAVVTDKKQMEFEFFRCFDLSVYDDDAPNIDLRVKEETGEDYDEEQTNK